MEKIISWIWKQPDGSRREDAYWFDGENLIVARGDQKPEDSQEVMNVAELVMPSYEARGRGKLTSHSQAVYDFLKARGF